jgi:PadR family transcriptional regulator PadR
MKKNTPLGAFEELVVLAIISLDDNAYGVTIRQKIEAAAGRSVSVGAIYTTLERLEHKGLISSNLGEATPERGGRAKRFFKVEAAGVQTLQSMIVNRERLTERPLLGWNTSRGTA